MTKALKDNPPRVSIITVVFNNGELIERCISSVLSQSYDNIEYIVVDGGSTDGTIDVISKYKHAIDHLISEPDDGIYDAMNKGLQRASGDYIAFLNSDDYYLSDAVDASIRHIREHDLDLSYAGFVYADQNEQVVLADEGRPWDDSMLIQGIPGGHETFFAHRRCYEIIGNFSLEYRVAADYDWVMRAYKAGFAAKPLEKIILVMAMGGASFDEKIELEENFRLLQENFGDLEEQFLNQLYQLKFYKNWFHRQLSDQEMVELLATARGHAPEMMRSLWLTIENRKREPKGVISPATSPAPGKKRIAIALTFLTGVSGGAERIAIEMANELVSRGHAVTFISCHGRAGEPYYPLDERVRWIDIGIYPYKQYYHKRGEDLTLNFEDWSGFSFEKLRYRPSQDDFSEWLGRGHLWRTRVYRGFFSEHEFDVVLSHMPSTYPYVLLGRKKEDRTKHVAVLHNSPSFKFYSDLYPAESKMDRYLRLASLAKADKISVLFKEYIDQMPKVYQNRCVILPNFTALKTSDKKSRNDENKIILCVGRLSEQKDHATLLKSYARIKNSYPDWRLHIYGEGPLKEDLYLLCEELNLPADDIFKGVCQDISAAYRKAEIFAFPSVFEGFGLAVVEAMVFGLPVVCFNDCDGVKYLVDHKVNGLAIDRNNGIDEFAAALSLLIKNPEMRVRFGANGKEVARHYTVQKSADLLEDVISLPGNGTFEFSGRRALPALKNSSDMKVAIINSYLAGGAGLAAKRLHTSLHQTGCESRIFSFSPAQHETEYQLGIKPDKFALMHSLDRIAREKNRFEGSTLFSTCYPSLAPDQLAFLETFDVINLHWVSKMISNEMVSHLASLGKPLVWTLHDMNPFTGGCHYTHGCDKYMSDCRSCPQLKDNFDDYPAQVLKAKLRYWPDNITVVTPSRWLAECARDSAVFKNNRIEVIPNSLDTDIFKPIDKEEARAKLGLPKDKKIILFTCHNHKERRKGFPELLQAAAHLQDFSTQYHIITFGKESSEIAKLGIPYTALGYIEDEASLALGYNAVDATVLPTLEDNLPNTILESAACGTPVVAFNSGGVADAVLENVTGYLVTRGDCRELAEKIDFAVHRDVRQSCRNFAVDNFGFYAQSKRYLSLFKELLASPPKPRTKRVTDEPPEMGVTEDFPEMLRHQSKLLQIELTEQMKRSRRESQDVTQALQKESERLRSDNEHLRKESERLRSDNEHLRKGIQLITRSTSWRLTWPLRVIRIFLLNNDAFWVLLKNRLRNSK